AEGRVGDFKGSGVNYLIDKDNYIRERSHFNGLVRMKRVGDYFEFYVSRLKTGEDEGLQHDILKVPFTDANSTYSGKLRYVQINIARHTNGPSASVPRINLIKVTELFEITEDQTPYILEPGDVLTFDHVSRNILVNGEPRLDLKNFGGTWFPLKEGQQTIVVSPEDAFDATLTFEERFI